MAPKVPDFEGKKKSEIAILKTMGSNMSQKYRNTLKFFTFLL